jgi:hypothetical protein
MMSAVGMARYRVTPAGRRTLLNIDQGLGAWHAEHGSAAHDLHLSATKALRRAGLLTLYDTLTPEGVAVVELLKQGRL